MEDTMRDLLSKLDNILTESALKDKEDLTAKRKALGDLESDPVAGKDPEISAAINQRKADLEREAKSKGFEESFEIDREELKPAHDKGYGDASKGIDKNPFNPDSPAFKSYREGQMAYKRHFGESFEIGDEFGISFSEDHEIATTIVDILEDGIVIELDDAALEMLTNEGLTFLEGEVVTEEKQKGVDGKACWKGYKRMGTKQKGGKTVDNCVKMGEDLEISEKAPPGDKAERMVKHIKKGYADDGKLTDKEKSIAYATAWKHHNKKNEDHGPENSDAPVNYGEYDREGDMAKDQLRTIDDAAEELYSILDANENLPEWVQKKITLAVDYIDTARDYMKSNKYAEDAQTNEAEYQGRKVQLGKKMAGDVKKSKVYVKNPQGRVVKVNFGDKKMKIKKSNPARRKSFRARHNCANPGPRHKARYWSCRSW
jgi:hypothetical protein